MNEGTSLVGNLEAIDPNGNTIEWRATGADANLFTVDRNSGEIYFQQGGDPNIPDYENPRDENSDGIYELTIFADDGSISISRNITIEVVDVPQQIAQIGNNITSKGDAVDISRYGNTLGIFNGWNDYEVNIYEFVGGVWAQKGSTLAANSGGTQPLTLNIDGSIVAVANANEVTVYIWDGQDWVSRGNSIEENAVAIDLNADGDLIAISTDNDQIKTFNFDGSSWSQVGNDISVEQSSQSFGFSLSLDAHGSTLAVGARLGNDDDSGFVNVYSWNGSSWQIIGSSINGESANDASGYSVKLSSNGSRGLLVPEMQVTSREVQEYLKTKIIIGFRLDKHFMVKLKKIHLEGS